jgi:predicted dehydrogenase
MTAKTIRVGVIGCGFYAQNHLHAWRDLATQGAKLAAVCDIDPAKARAAGDSFGLPWHTDVKAMLEVEDLDAADIVTRQDTHREIAETTIAHGVATIVQKPFAPSWEDATAIVSAARKAGVWLAVHENFRYQAPLRAVRKAIESGAIGNPSWARIAFRTGFDVYATQPYFYEEERFVIADVGVHVLDVARFLLGDVSRISCETQRRNPRVRAEDTATMMLRHESGAVSLVECTYEARRTDDPFPETLLEIEGPRGSIVVSRGCRMTLTSDGKASEHDIGAPLLSWTSHPWHVSQEGAIGACRHFLDCLRRGVPAETRGDDNLKTYALVDAAYKAAAEQRAVVPEKWS